MMTKRGDNSQLLNEDEERAIFFSHYGVIAEQLEIVRQERERLTKLRKLAKADGVVLADLDFAMRQDQGAMSGEMERRLKVMRWLALPIDYQGDLLASASESYEEGRLASALGRIGKAPDKYAQDEAQDWLRGYADDQEERHAALEDALNKLRPVQERAAAGPELTETEASLDEEGADPFDDVMTEVTAGKVQSA